MDEESLVASLYRAVLMREPDPQGLAVHVNALRNGLSTEQIVTRFLNSAEYRAKPTRLAKTYALDAAPAMDIEFALTPEQKKELWAHVARSWGGLGISEPYWSVLTDPKWKASRMSEAEIVEAFYQTGADSVARIDKWLARSSASAGATGTCVEYGCGVGRCTIWLARRFARVIACDISEPHLKLARERAALEGLNNIEFVHVTGEGDLRALNAIDFFYSVVVLQHNPPPLILSILEKMFKGVKDRGIAYFQVPTYASDYSFRLSEYMKRLDRPGMEMHFVPQHAVFDLAAAHGMVPLEVSPDGMIGKAGQWISTSFLMAKRAGRSGTGS